MNHAERLVVDVAGLHCFFCLICFLEMVRILPRGGEAASQQGNLQSFCFLRTHDIGFQSNQRILYIYIPSNQVD